jgi:uncharacterized protein
LNVFSDALRKCWVDAVLLLFLEGALHAVFRALDPRYGAPLVQVSVSALTMLLFVALRLRSDSAPFKMLGLTRERLGQDVLVGLLAVVVLYALASLALAPFLLLNKRSLDAASADKSEAMAMLARIPIAQALLLAVLAGFYEELVFRGFLLQRLASGFESMMSPRRAAWIAAVASSVLFGLGHVYQGAIGVVQSLVVGLGLSLLRLQRGRLCAPIVAHVTIDLLGMLLLPHLASRA